MLQLALLLVLLAAPTLAQTPDVKGYVRDHQAEIFREFHDLVAVPNIHGDFASLAKNAAHLKALLARRGLNPEIWESPNAAPLVFGQRLVPGATRTILFYLHYDGQPVDRARWHQPDPFVPVLRNGSLEDGATIVPDPLNLKTFPPDWRLYGRAAGDDKGPIIALLAALDAIKGAPASNIKVILDGEEEGGGLGLSAALLTHRAQLKADLMVFVDGPQHPSGRPTLYYGARGGTRLDLTVYTAKVGMHSGNYGNWMPDANVRLAQLLASMVDPSGKVAIADFYADVTPLPPSAWKLIDSVPDDSASMQKLYGVGSTDGAARSLQEGLNLPTFSVHMMKGGEVGGVIPASASAEIALRLVKENSARTMQDRVIAHIRKQGYFITETDPDVATLAAHPKIVKVKRSPGPNAAWRTEPEHPQAVFLTEALRNVWGDRLVRLRTLGGGLPAMPFISALQVPVIGVALANYDDNQHTDDENLRLGNLWTGIETLAGILLKR